MDGAPPCAVRSPVTCSGLSPGEHRFEVYAENAAGRKYDTVKWSFLVL